MSGLSHRNLSLRNWIIIISCLIAIALFFLPWWSQSQMGIRYFLDTGLELAKSGRSTSGIPFAVFFATLIAPIVCLFSCVVYLKQAKNIFFPLAQIALGVIGLVPFVLLIFIIKHAIRRGGGSQFWFSYAFIATIIALFGIVIGALLSYVEIKRLSASS
jgi:hypothetical protein